MNKIFRELLKLGSFLPSLPFIGMLFIQQLVSFNFDLLCYFYLGSGIGKGYT